MTSPIVQPRVRFFDANGAPLSLGWLHTYVAGTTTNKPTYTDSTGATANTNPIHLDAAGECVVWLADDGPYDFALTDAALAVQPAPGLNVSSLGRIASSGVDTLRADLASSASNAVGAGLVGFNPALNYATSTIGAWVTQEVNVLEYIPPSEWAAIFAGTSTYDATAAINSAIAAAAARPPCRVVFPCGKYKANSALNQITASDLTIDFQGSTLDFSGVQTALFERLIYVIGTYGATAALTSNAASGATTLAVSSSSFAVGDFVRVYSSTLWDSTRTNTRIGEINAIDTVPGASSVTLVDGTKSAYTTAATATLQKLSMCRNVHIKNGTLIGPGANDQLSGIEIRLGLECSIQNMNSRDIDNHHFKLTDCVQSRVAFCHFHESYENSQAYAVSFCDATQDCLLIGSTMREVRHGFTTNNNVTTSYGITRRCLIQSNQVYNNVPNVGGASGDALDTHAGAEHIAFIGNTVSGAYGIGINIEARSCLVQNNMIRGSSASGIIYAPYASAEAGEAIITGNDVQSVGDGAGTDYGIIVAPRVASIKRLVISDNKILSVNTAISIAGTASYSISNFTVTGNVAEIWEAGPGTPGTHGIQVEYGAGGTIGSNWASGTTRGIEVADCTYVSITGNYAQITASSGSVGYGVRAAGTSTHINMTGNTARYTSTGIASTIGVSATSGSSNCGVWSNITNGFGTSASSGGGAGSVAANNI